MKNDGKLFKLKQILSSFERVVVAFSGGVDSSYLLYAAKETLGEKNIVAVIAQSPTYPSSEVEEAIKIADHIGVVPKIINTDEFLDENFVANPKERCYYCKKELFAKLSEMAKEAGIKLVLDGSNHDDLNDIRPGSRAKKEFGVRSPLQEAGLTKKEIRELSKKAGLPNWDKPAMACLASRIPYGTRIDEKKLKMIAGGEEFLRSLGFRQNRVRHHAPIARIEVEKEDLPLIMEKEIMVQIVKKFEDLGYNYVTLDLKGYQMGSMNLE